MVKATGADPNVSASHIARLVKLLKIADPPYTPEEVLHWSALVQDRGHTPSLGYLEKDIGAVRRKPPPANGRNHVGSGVSYRYDPERDAGK